MDPLLELGSLSHLALWAIQSFNWLVLNDISALASAIPDRKGAIYEAANQVWMLDDGGVRICNVGVGTEHRNR